MPVLQITSADGTEWLFRIDSTTQFGRSGDSGLEISGRGISRKHGRFLQAADGSWWVEDLQSKNGIQVNGRQVDRHRLAYGDRLTVGDTTITFLTDVADAPGREDPGVTISEIARSSYPTVEREPAGPSGIEARRLASLYEISRQLLDQRDVRGLIEVACSALINAIDAGVVVIGLTCDPQRDKEMLFVRPASMQRACVTLSLSVLRRTLDARKSVLIAETSSDKDMWAAQSVVLGGIQSALCVPLMRDRQVTGFIYVDSRQSQRRYDELDLDFASAVGSLVGTAVEVARLHEAEIAKLRMEAELAAARRVQQAILPSIWPSVPGWEIQGYHQSCHEVGGDYHDAILADDGRLWLVVADVCGKGAPAALLASSVHAAVHALIGHCSSPADLLAKINALLLRRQIDQSFVTCQVAVVDVGTGSAVFASAGHPCPMWAGPAAGPSVLSLRPGLLLAAGVEGTIPETPWQFPDTGATLLLYTDGVSEAMSPEHEQFGTDRMLQAMSERGSTPAKEMIDQMRSAVEQFRGSCPPSDDLTMLACRRLPVA
jgi:phosphoserine phosphatase RsbU/P